MPGGASTRASLSTWPPTPLSCATSATWCRSPQDVHDRHPGRGPGNRHDRRAAAGGAGQQSALRAQCRQCPLGEPLRRAVRHRCHPAGGSGCQRLRPGARRSASSPTAASSSTRSRRCSPAAMPMPRAIPSRMAQLRVQLDDGIVTGLLESRALCGLARHAGAAHCRPAAQQRPARGDRPSIARIASAGPIAAGIADLVIEAALTTIQDCEDSVAAVDADEKVGVYRNWLGLMNGRLEASFAKGGRHRGAPPQRRSSLHRSRGPGTDAARAQPDAGAQCRSPHETDWCCSTASRCTRRVSMPASRWPSPCMTSSAAGATAAPARPMWSSPRCTARTKWRMANDLFDRVEDLLGLPRHTVKMGVMDEERRTSANLAACIAAARHRIVFINTGFLDRTGDEIHTVHGGRPGAAQGSRSRPSPGSAPTRSATCRSASPWDFPAGRRSARACGPCPTAWPKCCKTKRRIRRPGPTRRGCPRPPPRRCMRCTTTASTCAPCSSDCRPMPRLAPTTC